MRFLLAWMVGLSSVAFCQSTLFVNGKILISWTPHPTWTSQILVENGKIKAVGDQLKAPSGAKRWDLQGKWILPAFADAHAHLIETGELEDHLDLRGKSIEEITQLIKKTISDHPQTQSVVGFGWDQTIWPKKQFPDRALLDAISKSIPIILYRVDGHAAWINSAAGFRAQLNDADKRSSPKPGILVDSGLEKLKALIALKSEETVQAEMRRVVKRALALGITSIHDAGISPRNYKILKNLIRAENLPFRFYEMASFQNLASLEKEVLDRGPDFELLEGRLSLRTIKLFIDGAMGSRGALFDEPYLDDPNVRGIQLMKREALEKVIQLAAQKGFQVAVHAIGSRANAIAVAAFEKIFGKNTRAQRPRLEHAQILDRSLIEKIGKLGIIASMQPIHCPSDSQWVFERIGKERAQYGYAWNSLLNAHAPLAFGSDSPIEDINPWWGLFAATTRMRADLTPPEGFLPQEKISLTQAWQAYTSGAAYAAFQEDSLGTLTPGKWADFVVLDRNPFELNSSDLLQTQVRATFMSGHQAYP